MGARKVKVTLHRVSLYISEDHLFFFSKFGEVADVTLVSEAGIATGAVEIMLTVYRKNFIIKSIILWQFTYPVVEILLKRRH